MIVFRLETEANEGVYYAGFGFKAENLSTQIHDAPSIDKLFGKFWNSKKEPEQKKWFFGFIDQSDIFSWFDTDEAIEYLHSKKIKISKYNIHGRYVKKGEKQLIFKKEYAKLISQDSLL